MTSRSTRLLVLALAAVATGACGTAQMTAPTTLDPLAPVTHAGTLPRAGEGGAPHLSARVVLGASRVVAGAPLDATVVVTSRLGRRVDLSGPCGADYAVVLTNSHVPPTVAFPAVCSNAPLWIHPGTNRLAVEVLTTYDVCTNSPTPEDGPGLRPCTAHGPPPLPPGRYRAVLVGDLAVGRARPAFVTLVAGP